MGQVFKEYWTNTSKKPKGFKFIGNNTYKYEINIYINHLRDNRQIFKEILPVKYFTDKKTNFREIDMNSLMKIIKKKINIDYHLTEYYDGFSFFRRDGSTFSFLEWLNLSNKQGEEYLRYKGLRERIIKINKLKHKM